MNEEILSGLKVAVGRGSSLDSAVQSFINAGYNSADVREAAAVLYQGGKVMPSLPSIQTAFPSKLAMPSLPAPKAEQQKPAAASRTMKIILLVLTLIVLLVAVISVIVFREGIISFIENLFS